MHNQKYSISAIAKKLEISRNTVYKYIKKTPDEMAEWTASTMTRRKKLDEYKELILHWLREYKVGESTVRNYVRCIREEYGIPKEAHSRDYEPCPI